MPQGDAIHPAASAHGAERARRVRDMFAGIAPRYALVNTIASAGLDGGWRTAAVRALDLPPGAWCLDACCGTGDLSRALAAAGARVLGVDFCRAMLEQARAASAGDAPRTVAHAEGDAMSLPVADRAFDGACVAFGLRNVVEPERALREMVRAVRPGGRVVVLEFTEPAWGPLRTAYRLYCGHVLPVIGDIVSGRRGTYRYLPQTIRTWYRPKELAAIMEDCGLQDVTHHLMGFGVVGLHVGVVPPVSSTASASR